MSNALAMELLKQSLGSSSGAVGASGYGGCCGTGGALLGGGARRPKQLRPMPIHLPNVSPQTAQNLARAQAGFAVGGMKPQQYLKLHSPEAKLKARQTRVATANRAKEEYNARILSGNPMSKLEYCMTKCKISNQNRRVRAQESTLRRLGRVPRLGPVFNPLMAGVQSGLEREALPALEEKSGFI